MRNGCALARDDPFRHRNLIAGISIVIALNKSSTDRF
jgi:hypothetical protein